MRNARYELSAKQKQIEKDEKRIKELDRLFRKIYEDNVNGKLNDERFYKLSDGYEAEQEQLKQESETLTAEVSEADTRSDQCLQADSRHQKYTRIDELTPEVLNAFVDKIVVHEREKKRRETDTANRHLLFLCRDCGHPHGRGNAGNGTGIYAAHYTSNRLNTGVAGENLCSCRYISIFIPIWFGSILMTSKPNAGVYVYDGTKRLEETEKTTNLLYAKDLTARASKRRAKVTVTAMANYGEAAL